MHNQYGNNPPPLTLNTNNFMPGKLKYNVTPNSTNNSAFNSMGKLDKSHVQKAMNSSKPANKQTTNSIES